MAGASPLPTFDCPNVLHSGRLGPNLPSQAKLGDSRSCLRGQGEVLFRHSTLERLAGASKIDCPGQFLIGIPLIASAAYGNLLLLCKPGTYPNWAFPNRFQTIPVRYCTGGIEFLEPRRFRGNGPWPNHSLFLALVTCRFCTCYLEPQTLRPTGLRQSRSSDAGSRFFGIWLATLDSGLRTRLPWPACGPCWPDLPCNFCTCSPHIPYRYKSNRLVDSYLSGSPPAA